MEYTLRPLTVEDWQLLRELRTAALADAPTAFETTVADVGGWPDERWRTRAEGSARSQDIAVFAGAEAVAMAGLYVEDDGSADVISVWVHPDHRGRGIARRMVNAVLDMARERGVGVIRLWVTVGNKTARALYLDMGFEPTGRTQSMAARPWIVEEQMELVGRTT